MNAFYPRDKGVCRKKYGYKLDDKIVLGIAVGYSDPRKGARYMLELAREMNAKQQQEMQSIKMVLIGWEHSNDDMLRGITNIEVLPAIADVNILAEYYSLADVFVLTSLAENYATVNLEAIACGTPVVGFDCGGTPEQLVGGAGIVVPTGNQKALNQAVWQVLEGQTSLLEGEDLSERIRTENSLDRMTRQYHKIYKKLVNEKNIK